MQNTITRYNRYFFSVPKDEKHSVISISSFQSAMPILTITEVLDLQKREEEEMLEVTTYMMEM